MRILAVAVLALLSIILPAAAYNPLTGSQNDTLCEACLDDAVASCGDMNGPGFSKCICDGMGTAEIGICLPICNEWDGIYGSTGVAITTGLYKYCVLQFPEWCAEADQHLDPQDYQDVCSDVDLNALDKSGGQAHSVQTGLSAAAVGLLALAMFGLVG